MPCALPSLRHDYIETLHKIHTFHNEKIYRLIEKEDSNKLTVGICGRIELEIG